MAAAVASSGVGPDGSWVMQQTMLRIKDPKPSLDFYTNVLGMTLIMHKEFPQYKFSLYFLGYLPKGMRKEDLPPPNSAARDVLATQLPGLIELTHNHGTEVEAGPAYHTGNSYDNCEGGFGHIGVTVPDVYAACARFKSLGAAFKKSPNSGGMKGLAFVKDPDGYAIEVVHQGSAPVTQAMDCCGFSLDGAATGELPIGGGGGGDAPSCMPDVTPYYAAEADAATAGFVMQQTMLRIKEPKRSLDFYQRILGMTLVKQLDFPQWGFSLYFMGYLPKGMTEADLPPAESGERMAFLWSLPATVELTHNHGSEASEADRVYHPGNNVDGVKGGFGHIGITLPDVYAACERFKSEGVEFQKSPNSGGMKGLAFVKDPDGYWIEIIHQGEPRATKPEVDCLGVHINGGGGYTGGGDGSAAKK